MYSIIDIETTGGNTASNKITEIAIYVHDGKQIVDEFVSLINPERRIPYHITTLTGINDDMVAHSPKFYEVAKRVVEMTEGTVFVAHNSAFDYNFIRNEFKALGFTYKRDQLCTVKLSRKLMPGKKSYSLGKLCKELGIEINGRHRAAGDALATVKLFEMLLEIENDPLKVAGGKLDLEALGMHSNITRDFLSGIPKETGVYYFHDELGNLIYVGKSVDIRSRVISHINNNTTKRAVEMRRRIADITWALTGSELIALLKESDEIKRLKPFFNRAQRRGGNVHGLFAGFDPHGYTNLSVDKVNKRGDVPLTVFNSAREGREFLLYLVSQNTLCQKLSGLYKTSGSCFHYALHQCKGACIQKESPEEYNERVQEAIRSFTYEHQNVLIIDRGRHEEEVAVVSIQNGRYMGFGFTDPDTAKNDVEQLMDCIRPLPDNRDVQQIIRGYLRRNSVENLIVF